MSGYDPAVVAAIRQIGQQRYGSDPKKLRRYLLGQFETGIVESGLQNLQGGDADSYGYRQQRQGIYGRQPLEKQINNLYDEFEQFDRGQTVGQLAADVQRPAAQYRGRYGQVLDQARALAGGSNVSGAGAASMGAQVAPQATASTGPNTGNIFDFFASSTPTSNPLQEQLQRGWQLLSQLQDQRTGGSVGNQAATIAPTGGSTISGDLPHGAAGKVVMAKGADRPGVSTNPAVIDFVGQIAGLYGHPLTIGTGTQHSQMTTSGNVSDHWTGKAADIPAEGDALTRLGQDALISAGMDPQKARKQKGGLYNINGYQVIFNTTEGGNHWNHLHVGLGKLLRK